MTPIDLYTGSPGAGARLAAAATALHSADAGQRTLLLGLEGSIGLGALLGTTLAATPTTVAPDLDVLGLDAAAALRALWEQGRATMPARLAQIGGDELPLLPGLGTLFGLLQIEALRANYQQIVIDAGAVDPLLAILGLPDAMRWGVRLAIGLDREPGKNPASLARAMLPTGLLPLTLLDQLQDARVAAERARSDIFPAASTRAHFVLRPDAVALAEARLALPALQLFGLPVADVLIGPDSTAIATAPDTWPSRPTQRFGPPNDTGLAGLRTLAVQIGAPAQANGAPIVADPDGQPGIAIDLPGIAASALKLTISGDELIVMIGPYRRHLLLPASMRGVRGIRATRAGDRLVVRPR